MKRAFPAFLNGRGVRDWRVQQLGKLANVEVFLGSTMTHDDVLATGARHVMIATGAQWRGERYGTALAGCHCLL